MSKKFTVIDLFAGPGGLGEGFSSFSPEANIRPFSIGLSVEKEASAHKTLQLRAFVRQFGNAIPASYYQYLTGTISREELFELHAKESEAALDETLEFPRALGNEQDDEVIYKRLEVLKQTGERFVLIGGPPCQAYSLVGRARNMGIEGYRAEDDHRHFLYEEYLRVLETMQPDVFVMENVKGILSAKVNGEGIFDSILKDLANPARALKKKRGPRYRIYSLVEESSPPPSNGSTPDYVIRSEEYGIPQSRHRVILLGVREDISKIPGRLKRTRPKITTAEVISDCPPLRSGLSKTKDTAESWLDAVVKAAPKVAKALDDAGLDGSKVRSIGEQSQSLKSRGARFIPRKRKFRGTAEAMNWYLDDNLNGFVNHETRGHIADDLARYMFCAAFSKQKSGDSPRASDFPSSLAPKHANWTSGKFVDRFKVQSANKPSSTVTSHISKDGHYFIHPDPFQCRSLTVREVARLQTFPDNYFFEGNRTQQYVQVGNAVPPLLARQIAKIVYDVLSGD